MLHGFYSLIQFVPDIERAEGANIGILVFSPQSNPSILAIHSSRPPHLRNLCQNLPSERDLQQLMQSFEQRLRNDAPTDLPTLIKALGREAGKLRAVTPRAVPVADMRATATDLCARLVGEALHRDRLPRKIAKIEALRKEFGMADIIQSGVSVPLAGKSFRAPYVWVNGKPNVVVNANIRDNQSAAETAILWGGKGDLLLNSPADGVSRKLAVVTKISPGVSTDMRKSVGSIFENFAVDWIRPDTLDDYVDRIRDEAHSIGPEEMPH